MILLKNVKTFNDNSLGLCFQNSQYNEETFCLATNKPPFFDDLTGSEM